MAEGTTHRIEGPSSTHCNPSLQVPGTQSLTLSGGKQFTTAGKGSGLSRILHTSPSMHCMSMHVIGRSIGGRRMQRARRICRQFGRFVGHAGGLTSSIHWRVLVHSFVSQVGTSQRSVTFPSLKKKFAVQSPPKQRLGLHSALKNRGHTWSSQGSTSHSVASSGQLSC